jgi:hypothetical protein
MAPTMSAVAELQAVGFDDAVTVERMLRDQRRQDSLGGSVIILDEAGMISGRQMSELLCLAEREGARVVLTGDTRQIQSVEAGDALRILEKESRLKSVSLVQVQRQSDEAYRAAIEELRRDPERGFDLLEGIGAVRIVGWDERAATMAKAWKSARGSVLVVCATHEEIDKVTVAIREDRKQAGELGESRLVARDIALGWTTAQKTDWRNFRPGLVLGFHRAVKGISRNSVLEVVQADGRGVVVRGADGNEHTLTRKQARSFDVYERKAMEAAAGDQLLFTMNRGQPGFAATNGEIVAVERIDGSGRICLKDGRVMPLDYTHLSHGYAVTAHRSQGKSVDEVIVSADGMSRESFYVAASRGRSRITVFTSDADALRESVGRSSARQSATELARRALVRGERGIRRGAAAARELLRVAARHGMPPTQPAFIGLGTKGRETREHGIGR